MVVRRTELVGDGSAAEVCESEPITPMCVLETQQQRRCVSQSP